MVKFPQHKLSIYQVQTSHHETLYIESLPEAIKAQCSSTDGMSDFEIEVFVNTSLTWELGELEMVGYVGLFHLWEKYSKDFISSVLGKKAREWPSMPRISYPKRVFNHLENMGITISEEVQSNLVKANSVVNAYKHGEEALDKLLLEYPDYFSVPGEVDSFCIPDGELKNLFNSVYSFWKEVERQVEIDFNW